MGVDRTKAEDATGSSEFFGLVAERAGGIRTDYAAVTDDKDTLPLGGADALAAGEGESPQTQDLFIERR